MFVNRSLLMQILINVLGGCCMFVAREECGQSTAVAYSPVLPSVRMCGSSFLVLLCSVLSLLVCILKF